MTWLLTLLFAVPAADACTCVLPPPIDGPRPADGETYVPTNTLLWFGNGPGWYGPDSDAAVLRDVDGQRVDTIRRVVQQGIVALEPVEFLRPNETYIISFGTGDPFDDIHFRTRERPIRRRPKTPEVLRAHAYGFPAGGSTCGPATGGNMTVWAPRAAWVVAGPGPAEDEPLELFDSDAPRRPRFHTVASGTRAEVPLGSCGGGPDVGSRATYRFTAIDLAGNVSLPSAPRTVTFCGCQNSTPAGAAGALVLLALGAVRRRRQNPSSSSPSGGGQGSGG